MALRRSTLWAAVLLILPAGSPLTLEVLDETGRQLASADLPDDGRWCLAWNHSVTGEPVRDCFRADQDLLLLERSHQIDFSSAGLGHIPGRGTIVPDDLGGQWIEDIDVSIPGAELLLRVGGSKVDHQLLIGTRAIDLSSIAAGKKVTIVPTGTKP